LEGAAYLEAISQSVAESQKPGLEERLILVDTTGSVIDREVVKALKQLSAQTPGRISKIAVLGVTGIQRIFLRTVASFSKVNIKPFLNKEDALAWLTT
jgi:flagellar biosynthesis GTPase FlhF